MKLINTNMYLLLIDEEAEKTGYIFAKDTNIVFQDLSEGDKRGIRQFSQLYVKIIAYRKLNENAKELDLPELPPFEEKPLMEQAIKLRKERGYHKDSHYSFCGGFIEGYKAAQSKQFSLEDMKNHIQDFLDFCSQNYSYDSTFGWYENGNPGHRPNTSNLIENYIQSLSTQQLPKEFIPEYDEIIVDKLVPKMPIDTIKTIINSEGKEVLVGTYKY